MQTNNSNKTLPSASQPAVACDLTAIPADDRATHIMTAQHLFERAEHVTELANGIEFALPNDSATLLQAAQFIAQERQCCPFFTFTLEAKRSGEPLSLRLTGGHGVKEFLLSEFSDQLKVAITPARQRAVSEST
jgi:hypothetical protein